MKTNKVVQQRILIVISFLLTFFPVIILRLFQVQVVEHVYYEEEAKKYRDRIEEIPPRRGAIRDRNAVILAEATSRYELRVRLAYIRNKEGQIEENFTITNLSRLLNVDAIEILELCREKNILVEEIIRKRIERDIAAGGKKREVIRQHTKDYLHRAYPLRNFDNIDKKTALMFRYGKSFYAEKSKYELESHDMYKGFDIAPVVHRKYKENDMAPHLLGGIGKISREELRQRDKDYRITDYTGKRGLEKVFEYNLKGTRGAIAKDRRSADNYNDPSKDGEDIYLTIDHVAQRVAEEALDEYVEKYHPQALGGGAAVIDIKTGEIIVLATSPRYDNTKFSKLYKGMSQDKKRPLENRAIYNAYPSPPGSIFKIISGIAALEEGLIDQRTVFHCRGYLHHPRAFRCTHRHGDVDFVDAIAQSCNIYFYKVGEMLGQKRLAQWGTAFGFGQKTGIILPGEQRGFFPTEQAWKRVSKNPWTKGSSRMLGIGQILEATPLQTARAMAVVANRGWCPPLKVIKGFNMPLSPQKKANVGLGINVPNLRPVALPMSRFRSYQPTSRALPKVEFSRHTYHLVKKGMYGVVHGNHGTAMKIRYILKDIKIASKTGTSQVARGPDNSWFAGFVPYDNPKYAFAAYVEHGGYGGRAAAPAIARTIRAIFYPEEFEKKADESEGDE